MADDVHGIDAAIRGEIIGDLLHAIARADVIAAARVCASSNVSGWVTSAVGSGAGPAVGESAVVSPSVTTVATMAPSKAMRCSRAMYDSPLLSSAFKRSSFATADASPLPKEKGPDFLLILAKARLTLRTPSASLIVQPVRARTMHNARLMPA